MEEEKKKEKSIKNIIFVLIILLILLISLIFVMYVLGKGKGYFIYKGKGGEYRIDKVGFGNMTEYHLHFDVSGTPYIYKFRNDPGDLEDIPLEDSVKKNIINKDWVYVTQDVDKIGAKSLIGKMEFIQILGQRLEGVYKLNVKAAFTTKFEDIPVVNCNDINESVGVIYLGLGSENKIYSQNGCVIIEGVDDEGLLLSSEKFAYHLLEVF